MVQQEPSMVRALVYSVVLVLFLRLARVYGFVLLSANFGVLLRASIQIPAGTKGSPGRHGGRRVGQNVNRQSAPSLPPNAPPAPQARPNLHPTSTPRKSKSSPPTLHSPSPPPYSLTAPKSNVEPRPESILKLYEDIIASDAQTIKVQQDTMCAQQETIRAQAQMIKNMRLILERQDERIDELESATQMVSAAEQGTRSE